MTSSMVKMMPCLLAEPVMRASFYIMQCQHLSASTVCAYTRALAQSYPDVHVADSAVFQEIETCRVRRVGGLRRLRRLLGLSTRGLKRLNTLIFPICDGEHWTVVVVYRAPQLPAEWLIAHYDSAPDSTRHHAQLAAIQWALSATLGIRVQTKLSPAQYNVPPQQDSHSCGPIVCMVVECVCRSLDVRAISTDSTTVQRYRNHIRVFMGAN